MRIIVTGGRDYTDTIVVAYALAHYAPTGPHTLVHGACKTLREDRTLYTLKAGEKPGADRLAHGFSSGRPVAPCVDHGPASRVLSG